MVLGARFVLPLPIPGPFHPILDRNHGQVSSMVDVLAVRPLAGDAPVVDFPARPLREITSAYSEPNAIRSIAEFLITFLPFVALTGALFYGAAHGILASILLAPFAGALLVRLFTIQHDCGHGSYFKNRWANDALGRAIGVLTFTPYAFWRRSHNIHHATSGNLDRRGVGDIDTITVEEYLARSPRERLAYRMLRHPLTILLIGPAYQFLIQHRIPPASFSEEKEMWKSVAGTNLAILACAAAVATAFGWKALFLGYFPVFLVAASTGMWLFYIQHQYEGAYWRREGEWSFRDAALDGSSYYDLPAALHWITGHIGFHHIHHLSAKIPSYRLRACFEQNPEFQQARRLTIRSSLHCLNLALWDEAARRLVSFREIEGK